MSTTTIATRDVVLGTCGHLFRVGPWRDETGAVRDMSAQTVTAKLYAPDGTTATQSGTGTSDGYIYYRLASGDVDAVGSWGLRIFQVDADENLDGPRFTFTCVADE